MGNWKERWQTRLAKAKEDADANEMGKGLHWHSNYYHDQFEGYQEHYECVGGRRKIVRVYIGRLFRPDHPKKRELACRGLFLAGYLAGVALFVAGACMRIPTNFCMHIALLQAVALVLLFLLGMSVFHRVSHKVMKEREFRRGHARLLLFSKVWSIYCAVLAAAHMGTILIVRFPLGLASAACITMNLLNCGIWFILFQLEKNTEYELVPNSE